MTIADEARDNAIHCEMVKYAYRQTKDGVVVSFVVHPNDVPAGLSISHIGARYMVALVELGDDEQPKRKVVMPDSGKPRLHNAPPQSKLPSAGAKRDWVDLQPQQQAGIRCSEPAFMTFLREQHPDDWAECTDAVECVRLICGVHSRVELGTNQKARVIWHNLDAEFQAWKLVAV